MSTASPPAGSAGVGVHSLSEFVFCPRAGLLAYESGLDDDGSEHAVLRQDYLPDYDYRDLVEEIRSRLLGLQVLVGAALAIGVAAALLAVWLRREWAWAGLLVEAFLAWRVVAEVAALARLNLRRRVADSARAAEPDMGLSEDQPIGWWELRAAGFEATPAPDALADGPLRGRPWRILRRGDLAVPAFVRRTPGDVRPNHRTRAAAYCALIEACEGARSPFAVVLDRGLYRGVAVFPTAKDRVEMRSQLEAFRAVIAAVEQDLDPSAPEDEACCRGCPLGKPRRYRPGVTDTARHGRTLKPHSSSGYHSGEVYHSPCGDRFRWAPPQQSSGSARA